MSYLVLARKWRPKRFAELVGQQHVVQALTNALESGRVHHAFLFSGTRGVGKTTIARIFAKSLNCENGSSAEPCGVCDTCLAIDAGRYVDLLEIDAASHTGIDDVRELIDNAQYMPSRGRVKVYLIDEVHMLSRPAFNALLKTLEEPPGHVKFLLATTDPQKLPVTVLSRCLQFNLKRLDEQQIEGQISRILDAEGIAADAGAITQLSRAADGSLRDGLSLLDQAIAYTGAGAGGGRIGDAAVATMLGSVDRTRVGAMLDVLSAGDGRALMAEVTALAELSPDWGGVLDALADALHRIQVRQLVPGVDVAADGVDVAGLSTSLRPEIVQLWYQMALHGRRDLALAPSARTGFEMSVLRMLAFRPSDEGATATTTAAAAAPAGQGASVRSPVAASAYASASSSASPARGDGLAAAAARAALHADAPVLATAVSTPAAPAAVTPAAPAPVAATFASEQVAAASVAAPASIASTPAPVTVTASVSTPPPDAVTVAVSVQLDADQWHDLVTGSGLRGPTRELAAHAIFVGFESGVLTLALPAADDHLRAPTLVSLLARGLADALGCEPQIRFQVDAPVAGETIHQRSARGRGARQAQAETSFMADPGVQQLMQRRGATLVPDSIRPYDD